MGARGETTIETAARAYPFLLTNRALADIEKTLNKSIMVIGQRARDVDFSVTDTAVILQIGLEYARREQHWSTEPVRSPLAFAILDELGFQPVANAVLQCVLDVMSYEPKGDADNPPA